MNLSSIEQGMAVIWQNLDYFLWGNYPDGALEGIVLTLIMSLFAIIFSTLLGIIAGVGLTVLMGKWQKVLITVLGFFRAIPILMLIFWVYFLLPVILNVDVPGVATVIFALSLVGAAYIAHSVHAGMTTISQDQWQAAFSLGLTKREVIGLIILPQVIKMMMPSFVNQWVSLIKDSSLAYIVSVADFTFLATQVSNRTMVYQTEIFMFVIIVYFIICFTLDMVVSYFNCLKAY